MAQLRTYKHRFMCLNLIFYLTEQFCLTVYAAEYDSVQLI